MAKNGNVGGAGVLDIASFEANFQRAKDISRELKGINKEQEQLAAREQALLEEAQGLGIPVAGSGAAGTRKTRRSAKASAKRESKNGERGRGGSKTGETRMEMLYRILPGSDADPVNKETLTKQLKKEGYTSEAQAPEIGVGQDLGKMLAKGHATNTAGERGEWRLTKRGEQFREKLARQRAEANGETVEVAKPRASKKAAAKKTSKKTTKASRRKPEPEPVAASAPAANDGDASDNQGGDNASNGGDTPAE